MGGCNAVDGPEDKQEVELFFAGALNTKDLGAQLPERSQILTYVDAACFHDVNFTLGGSALAADNSAGVSHTAAGGSRQAGDETHHRFGDMLGDEGCRRFPPP